MCILLHAKWRVGNLFAKLFGTVMLLVHRLTPAMGEYMVLEGKVK